MPDLFIGLMSGTSMDGIDAVLVDFSTTPLQFLAGHHLPFSSELRAELLRLCAGDAPDAVNLLGRLDVRLGRMFADAALTLLQRAGTEPSAVRAIGSHGQTVRHEPAGDYPFTLQIGDPNIIAARTSITTVADFRRRDIAVGGQGAPLVPAFHAEAFRTTAEDRVVVNLGGMANITILPRVAAQPVRGFDTGPGNALLDGWIARHQHVELDVDGRWSAGAPVHAALLAALLEDPYFRQSPPKSTGREHFNLAWLDRALQRLGATPEPRQVQSTLCELTAVTVAQAMRAAAPATTRALICGGGARNQDLMRRLRAQLPGMEVEATGAHGLAPEWIEATAFAWLAHRTLQGAAGNLPDVTGAREPVVLGAVYPGTTGSARRD